jgi:hypothetical protein
LGVPEDSKFPHLGVWASPSHLAQSGVATVAILKKTTTPHPLAILSTNWDLDIMKKKHQNHTTSKLLLQTKYPHSPLSLNAKLASIKQSKQTYTISNNA